MYIYGFIRMMNRLTAEMVVTIQAHRVEALHCADHGQTTTGGTVGRPPLPPPTPTPRICKDTEEDRG